jgi:serine/threonine protein kinase
VDRIPLSKPLAADTMQSKHNLYLLYPYTCQLGQNDCLNFRVKLALGSNGQHYAIKVFKNNHALAANIKALANEIKIMQQMNHPNLVNIIEFNESMPYLVLLILHPIEKNR